MTQAQTFDWLDSIPEWREYEAALKAAIKSDTSENLERYERASQAWRLAEQRELQRLIVLPCEEVPPGEVWVIEPLTPLQRAAGIWPRVVGKVVNIGEEG